MEQPFLNRAKRLVDGFQWIGDESILEAEDRATKLPLFTTGISYLDDALLGIKRDDLVIVSGRSGQGKTELLTFLAKNISQLGSRVGFISLEDAKFSISRRIKWQLLMDKYYAEKRFANKKPRYAEWVRGVESTTRALDRFESGVNVEIASALPKLKIFYRSDSDYTIDDFEKQITALSNDFDVFCLDHIHFFDYGDTENENLALKRIIKKINDLSKTLCKPVISAAHVRKFDRRFYTPLPDMEEIHGSSDLMKIATIVIMVGRANVPSVSRTKVGTFIRVAKFRDDGAATIPTALIQFDLETKRYEQEYYLGEFEGVDFKPYKKNQLPDWAVNAAKE